MSLSTPAPSHGPVLWIAFLVVLVGSTLVQAWQAYHGLTDPDSSGTPAIYVNLTEPAPATPDPPAGGAPADLDVPPLNETTPPAPRVIRDIQAPKYEYIIDFTWDVRLSTTPLATTPWSGNGPPFVIIYYDGLNDTHIAHNAWINVNGGVGWDPCTNSLIWYWSWTPLDTTAVSRKLTYESNPMPENPFELAGTGENCYTRVYAESTWTYMACMEGDGYLDKMWEERLPDGTTVQHHDFMDYCFSGIQRIGVT